MPRLLSAFLLSQTLLNLCLHQEPKNVLGDICGMALEETGLGKECV